MDCRHGQMAVSAGEGDCVLVIAASDSSGGAGIARDLLTLGELGHAAAVALTAITVQSDDRVARISPAEPGLVAAQMRAGLEARPVAAIKIGMLASAAIIDEVAGELSRHGPIPVVLDPVIASSSGTTFLDDDALAALTRRLMPRCALITPNLPELAALEPGGPEQPVARARRLAGRVGAAVLVKGGHGAGAEAADILVRAGAAPVKMASRRLDASARGTGCMLSCAIAAHLARGETMEAACRKAKAHVWSKLAAAA